jgi:peptide alpha-N-acetyltransferase
VFRERAKKYLISGLEKGVPSLFVDVKGVYVDAKRMEIVGEILEETISQLEKDASLHDDGEYSPYRTGLTRLQTQ